MAELFSKPIACGMVTGAAAGAVTALWQCAIVASNTGNLTSDIAFDVCVMFLLCAGPALSNRSVKLLVGALVFGVVAAFVDLFFELVDFVAPTQISRFLNAHETLTLFTSSMVTGAIIGFGLAAMYGARRFKLWPALMGMVGQGLAFSIFFTLSLSEDQQRTEIWVVPLVLAFVATATLPAIPIECELRFADKRSRQISA